MTATKRPEKLTLIPSKTWSVADPLGGRHLIRQHEGDTPFIMASFFHAIGDIDRQLCEQFLKDYGVDTTQNDEPVPHALFKHNIPALSLPRPFNAVWVESDILGNLHIMMSSDYGSRVAYASFYYNYAHTSNAQIREDANRLVIGLIGRCDVTYRHRDVSDTLEDVPKSWWRE
ncbi:hypothetical protein AB6D11_00615 [Vibrio splendidus]